MYAIGTLIHETLTGAYEPASGTCFAISFMMRGFLITRRMIFALWR